MGSVRAYSLQSGEPVAVAALEISHSPPASLTARKLLLLHAPCTKPSSGPKDGNPLTSSLAAMTGMNREHVYEYSILVRNLRHPLLVHAPQTGQTETEQTMTPLPSPPAEALWFALYVRVRHERAVEKQLTEKGLEAFLPSFMTRRKWADRYKSVEFPLFPGYLFCRLFPHQRGLVLSAAGVVRIVGFGNQLMPVDEGEVLALQRAVQAGLPCEPTPYLTIGQRVRVGFGPLKGVEGILLEAKKSHRLVLSVTLLQRSVSVEVAADEIEAVAPSMHQISNPPGRSPVAPSRLVTLS